MLNTHIWVSTTRTEAQFLRTPFGKPWMIQEQRGKWPKVIAKKQGKENKGSHMKETEMWS